MLINYVYNYTLYSLYIPFKFLNLRLWNPQFLRFERCGALQEVKGRVWLFFISCKRFLSRLWRIAQWEMWPCYHSVQTLTLCMFDRSRRVLVIFVWWENKIVFFFFIYISEKIRGWSFVDGDFVVEHLYMVRDQSTKHVYICLHVNA